MNIDEELKPLRAQIDEIDAQIVELLNRRAEVVKKVGAVKGSANAPVYRPDREAEVLRKVWAQSKGAMTEKGISSIFKEIMSACRALEHKARVAYLGPQGTFSELAMLRQFGAGVDGIACERIDDVFHAVEAGSADYGIVPIENSTEGAVNRSMDCLQLTNLTIIAETSIPINHNLLTTSGCMDGVKRVYSHPQSLGQCVSWLNRHYPQLERVPAASNGEAARLASLDPESAAIAGEAAAEHYGLKIAYPSIQDQSTNRTRFVVLGKEGTSPSKAPGKDKTSLIISVPHKAGALFQALKPLYDHGVSMTRFESRPAKRGSWEYFFYVDIEGHCDDPKVRSALDDFRSSCASFKNLGSYPIANEESGSEDKGTKL
ncbi:prephenate dehydratase [uncultured Parasutterella sp.]|uniref:prephenate dehydratase n=1 Tax=uncultured Parasutterella sp. TaxID=1263098 RepID=UPI00259AAFD3|nr:prephenate dehydratase [uncultured Parasutterella sp.]